MLAVGNAAHHANLHVSNNAEDDNFLGTQPLARIQTTPRTTKAQQGWLRLFDQTLQRSHRHNPRAPPYVAPTGGLPLIGGDFDVVEIQPWPTDVLRIANNVFCCSQPYPATKRSSSYRDDCGYDMDRCLADNGTRATSSCINVNQDIVYDDSICFLGPECGNRMLQRFTLNLIRTPVGLGVVCDVAISKEAFIIEYVGEVLLGPDALARADRCYQVGMKAKASWEGPTDVFINASRCGNESRCINHSCRPNCAFFELEWTNTSRLDIYVKTDIPPLRELAFRYSDAKLSMFTCQ